MEGTGVHLFEVDAEGFVGGRGGGGVDAGVAGQPPSLAGDHVVAPIGRWLSLSLSDNDKKTLHWATNLQKRKEKWTIFRKNTESYQDNQMKKKL